MSSPNFVCFVLFEGVFALGLPTPYKDTKVSEEDDMIRARA